MRPHIPRSSRDGGEKSQELSETYTVSLRPMWDVPDCLKNSEEELENYISRVSAGLYSLDYLLAS